MSHFPAPAFLFALFSLVIAACGEPNIQTDCTMNGFGSGSCNFTNTGDKGGAVCGHVTVSAVKTALAETEERVQELSALLEEARAAAANATQASKDSHPAIEFGLSLYKRWAKIAVSENLHGELRRLAVDQAKKLSKESDNALPKRPGEGVEHFEELPPESPRRVSGDEIVVLEYTWQQRDEFSMALTGRAPRFLSPSDMAKMATDHEMAKATVRITPFAVLRLPTGTRATLATALRDVLAPILRKRLHEVLREEADAIGGERSAAMEELLTDMLRAEKAPETCLEEAIANGTKAKTVAEERAVAVDTIEKQLDAAHQLRERLSGLPIASANFCSGSVEPKSTVAANFAIPDVAVLCATSAVDSRAKWTDLCSFAFEEAGEK